MNSLYSLLGFGFLGLIFGSFGSVLLTRTADDFSRKKLRSLLIGRSQCPHCKHTLTPSELIPVVSFFFQKGKCKHCNKKISYLYPLLEIVSATIFLLTPLILSHLNPNISLGSVSLWIAIHRLLALLLVYDLWTYTLSDSVWRIALALSLGGQFFGLLGNYHHAFWGSLVFGGGFLLLYFGAKFYVRSRYKTKGDGLGLGDVYLAFLLGTLCSGVFSFQGIPFSFLALFELFLLFILLSSVLGIVLYFLQELVSKKYKHTTTLPFETVGPVLPFFPAMILAFWILLIFGEKLFSLAFYS